METTGKIAGGCELKIAQSGFFFFIVFVIEETKMFSP